MGWTDAETCRFLRCGGNCGEGWGMGGVVLVVPFQPL